MPATSTDITGNNQYIPSLKLIDSPITQTIMCHVVYHVCQVMSQAMCHVGCHDCQVVCHVVHHIVCHAFTGMQHYVINGTDTKSKLHDQKLHKQNALLLTASQMVHVTNHQ